MKLLTFFYISLCGLFLLITASSKKNMKDDFVINYPSNKVVLDYKSLDANNFSVPSEECYLEALKGYNTYKNKGFFQKNIITIIDFSLSSRVNRLWIIDIIQNKVLLNTLVSHGKKSGEDYANQFSNLQESNKSSLGFYATGEVYQGKHGMSLKLDGLEKGINDNARTRAIVIHGADYVSPSFLKNNSRLGRSLGCPAVPVSMCRKIIDIIKEKSCIFIYHSSKNRNKMLA